MSPAALAHASGPAVPNAAASLLTSRGPIYIEGDSNFTPQNGVVSGNGTSTDPFVISGWQIDTAEGNAIEVHNTSAFFVVRSVDVVNSRGVPPYNFTAYFANVTHAQVEYVNVSNGSQGFWISHSADVTLTRVNQSSAIGADVSVSYSDHVSVSNSLFSGGGLDAWTTSNLTVVSNHFLGANAYVGVVGSTQTTIDANVIDHGLISSNTTWNTTISNNRIGIGWILLGYGPLYNATVIGNTLGGVGYGIDAWSTPGILIAGNNVSSTREYAIAVTGAPNSTIVGNRVSDSQVGILIQLTVNASIFHNDFVHNAIQAETIRSSSLAWNATYPTGGNYWSDYTGVDLCSGPLQNNCTGPDGIGDAPYTIDASDVDAYPLMAFSGNDTTPPVVAITSPSEGAVFTTSPVAVLGSAGDAGGSGLRDVQVRVNDGTWTAATGLATWNATVSLTPGANRIEAEARDWAGNSALATANVTYNPPPPPPNTPPYANFTWTPGTGNTSTLFTFQSTSWDAQDPPSALEVRWDWETDGLWDTAWSTNGTTTHRFTTAAIYNVTLEVMDTGGLTSNRTFEVLVSAPPPPPPPPLEAVITATPTSGTMPLTVTFNSTVSGGVAPYSYDWHLGDGATTTAADTVHIYLTGGNFTVWLTVYDSASANALSNVLWVNVTAAAVNLSVVPIPPTQFTGSSNGITLTLAATVSGGTPPYTFLWAFGDGTTGTGANPVHTYAQPGVYNVTVTVTDAEGHSVSTTFQLSVPASTGPPPPAMFPLAATLGLMVAAVAAVAVAIYLALRGRKGRSLE